MAEAALRSRTGVAPEGAGMARSEPPPSVPHARNGRGSSPGPRWVARLEGAAMALGVLAAVGGAAVRPYLDVQRGDDVLPGVRLGGYAIGGLTPEGLRAVAVAAGLSSLDRPLQLAAGTAEVTRSARVLGAVVTPDDSMERALGVGRSGSLLVDLRARARAHAGELDLPIGYRFDEATALAALVELAPELDRPSLPTRLDMEARKVLPATDGTALLPYDSLSAVAVGLASGADRIDLVVQTKPPVDDPLAEIAATLDISVVVGRFDTPYSTDPSEADRNHNLKMGASAIDGTVIAPGETFSFNDVVGDRSLAAGYRWATGIAAGELIDSVGGGICQISSTVYGAAFFGGLEVVQSRPHTRPSTYVDMGLDSTVVYPDVDLVLRNQFDFPVVLHMQVHQGKVEAEVLGARRPYQVVFERELAEVRPFETVVRDDERLRAGTQTVAQRGLRGFKLVRRRILMQGGQPVGTQEWNLSYPPTTEILRRGTSPTGELPEQKPTPNYRDPAPELRIVQ